jgi:hypothetical protein
MTRFTVTIQVSIAFVEDFMKPLGLSQYRLAQKLNVPALA